MTIHTADVEIATIGELLRDTRIKRGLDLLTVAAETKISAKTLQAIEEGNFTSLPAEVFTRGFYSLYAKMLSLDVDQVLEKYGQERKKLKTGVQATPPPNRLAQDMAGLAERPTSLPSSYFGLILFLFLLFGAFLCWYFGWNPASYLSQKLRSLEEPQQIEQVLSEERKPKKPEIIFEVATAESSQSFLSEQKGLFTLSTVTAATRSTEHFKNAVVSPVPKYFLSAIFLKKTSLLVQIDDQPELKLSGKKGETITWQAGEKIIITLPRDTNTRLSMNNIPVELPKNNHVMRLSIPEDIHR